MAIIQETNGYSNAEQYSGDHTSSSRYHDNSQTNGTALNGSGATTKFDTQEKGHSNGVSEGTNGFNGVGTMQNGTHIQDSRNGAGSGGGINIICGPLLNYKHLDTTSGSSIWNGSVLIVAKPGSSTPSLELGPVSDKAQTRKFEASKLYQDTDKTFWQFTIDLPLSNQESEWQYSVIGASSSKRTRDKFSFFVPSAQSSMRIMFHSCNGFSVGTDEDEWSGPALWNDVVRKHQERPFHVMIGGGDQIYNDNVRVTGPLKGWTDIGNPIKRRDYPFGEQLRADCDEHYYQNYIGWYGQEPFATANAQIPQINIWDDHDIIDGFGSYTDHFMKCHVFRGIGGVAFKYYSLFQHHIAPPPTSFTSDDPHRQRALDSSVFVAKQKLDSSFIEGVGTGPYIEDKSLSIYARLGQQIAFLGIDARMERTRHQINYPETYDKIFSRLQSEVQRSNGQIKHLILLLGVPIAYPRLIWLENILTSPLIGPIRFLNKRFGLAGGLFNKFDGQVDLLDDLDDHYTARAHKKERLQLILRLQSFAQAQGIRVTILGGDVHLGAIGRFYTPTKYNVDVINDHRYMINIISSAITNKPPPKLVANMLGKRNKVHHLDHETHETLMPIFDKDPGGVPKNANSNDVTMPSRNYAVIEMNAAPQTNGASTNGANGTANGTTNGENTTTTATTKDHVKDGHSPLHIGEKEAGTTFATANGKGNGPFPGGLDVSLQVEIDNHDKEGKTEGYGFSIPPLIALQQQSRHHHRFSSLGRSSSLH